MVTRRAFLERAALLVAGLAVDPERLFWTPKSMIAVPANYVGFDLAAGPDWCGVGYWNDRRELLWSEMREAIRRGVVLPSNDDLRELIAPTYRVTAGTTVCDRR